MKNFEKETELNFREFDKAWRNDLDQVSSDLRKFAVTYQTNYKKIVSINAWRTSVLDEKISEESLSFFLEGQNDMLLSHLIASLGSWRLALKSLRSSIENVVYGLYYMDHPIELQQWHLGKHKLGFMETMKYLQAHPRIVDVDQGVNGISLLKMEYETLSKAVHGSAKAFRMTDGLVTTSFWSPSEESLGKWSTRAGKVSLALNLLLMTVFREDLTGTKQAGLRKAISLSVPASKHKAIKDQLKINLFRR